MNIVFAFEWKNWLLKPTTLLLLTIWIFIITFAVSNSTTLVQDREQRYDSLNLMLQERYQNHVILMDSFDMGYKSVATFWEDPRNAFNIGNYYGTRQMVKEPIALTAIAAGQSELHHSNHIISSASAFWFSALRKPEKLDNPTNTIYGRFDLSFVLVWLLPLLIIVLSYNSLSAEREQGTLKMLLAQGLSVKNLMVARFLFRFFTTTSITFLATFLALWFFDGNPTHDLLGLLFFILLMLCYSIFWYALAFLINLYNKSSFYNAGLLLTLWIALVLVMPALFNVIVTTLQPIPSKVVLIDEVRERHTENDRINSEILDQFYTDHPEFVIQDSSKLMPVFMYKYMIKEMNTSEQLQPVMDDYKNRLEGQNQYINFLALTIPSMAYQETLEEISGNSLSQYLSFQRAADIESRNWRNHFQKLSLGNKYLTIEEFKNLPFPSFETKINLSKIVILLGGMSIWTMLLLILAFTKIKRYKME